jgi:hypothetical protein
LLLPLNLFGVPSKPLSELSSCIYVLLLLLIAAVYVSFMIGSGVKSGLPVVTSKLLRWMECNASQILMHLFSNVKIV